VFRHFDWCIIYDITLYDALSALITLQYVTGEAYAYRVIEIVCIGTDH